MLNRTGFLQGHHNAREQQYIYCYIGSILLQTLPDSFHMYILFPFQSQHLVRYKFSCILCETFCFENRHIKSQLAH